MTICGRYDHDVQDDLGTELYQTENVPDPDAEEIAAVWPPGTSQGALGGAGAGFGCEGNGSIDGWTSSGPVNEFAELEQLARLSAKSAPRGSIVRMFGLQLVSHLRRGQLTRTKHGTESLKDREWSRTLLSRRYSETMSWGPVTPEVRPKGSQGTSQANTAGVARRPTFASNRIFLGHFRFRSR